MAEKLKCAHPSKCCWHLVQTTTVRDGGGTGEGQDTETKLCCHCGDITVKKWAVERDPDHGIHTRVMRRRLILEA